MAGALRAAGLLAEDGGGEEPERVRARRQAAAPGGAGDVRQAAGRQPVRRPGLSH